MCIRDSRNTVQPIPFFAGRVQNAPDDGQQPVDGGGGDPRAESRLGQSIQHGPVNLLQRQEAKNGIGLAQMTLDVA